MSADTDPFTVMGGAARMGEMLRLVRLDRELTPQALGNRLGMWGTDVTNIERGHAGIAGLPHVTHLARACRVSVSLFAVSFALPAEDPLPWPRESGPAVDPYDDPPGTEAMGAAIRAERLRRNWTQAALGERMGVSKWQILSLETGKLQQPTLLTITRLAYAMATTTPARMAIVSRLTQTFAGEVPPPRRRKLRAEPTESSA